MPKKKKKINKKKLYILLHCDAFQRKFEAVLVENFIEKINVLLFKTSLKVFYFISVLKNDTLTELYGGEVM